MAEWRVVSSAHSLVVVGSLSVCSPGRPVCAPRLGASQADDDVYFIEYVE
jgi:hypothetical protein